MVDKIDYKKAVERLANLEKFVVLDVNLNSFDRSLILCLLFDEDKEKTFDDILRNKSYIIS